MYLRVHSMYTHHVKLLLLYVVIYVIYRLHEHPLRSLFSFSCKVYLAQLPSTRLS